MTILVDWKIEKKAEHRSMIAPFLPEQRRTLSSGEKALSFGLSSAGYDLRITDPVVWIGGPDDVIDPKNVDPKKWGIPKVTEDESGKWFVIPAHGFALVSSIEYIRMPEKTFGICVGKSTLARVGVVCGATPIEPGWHGNLTIELSNTMTSPVKIYLEEGGCQVVFFDLDATPDVSYADGNRKYQGSLGTTLAR